MGPLPSTSTRGPASARHTVDYRGVYSRGTFEVTCYFCLPRNTLRAKDWAESTLLFVDMAASSATSAPLAPMCCPNCLQEFRATTGDINLTPQLFVVCGHHTCRLCAEMRALTAQCCPICASPSSYILDSALAEYSEFVWGQLHALKSVGCQDCAALVQDEEPDAATCECVECHRILCSLHAESHESLFKRRGKIDHSCAALPGRRPPSSGLCSEHRQAFSYFCFTHLAPLCSTCVLHDHGGMAATSGTAPPASAPVCNVRELTSSSDELRLRVGHAMHMCTVKARYEAYRPVCRALLPPHVTLLLAHKQ